MRVLVESPTCNAFAGSNSAVGYGWVREIARRHDVHLVTYGPIYDRGHPGGAAPPLPNVTPIRIPASRWRRLGTLTDYVAGARKRRREIVRAVRPDVVHSVEPGGWRGPRLFATDAAPYVLGPLNGGPVPSRGFATEVLGRLPQTPVRGLVAGGARAFVVRMVNEALFGDLFTAARLAHRAMRSARRVLVAGELSPGAVPADVAARVEEVPLLGLDLGLFRPPPARDPDAPFTVLYAGRIVAWKGLHLLIEAMAATGASLRIAGPTDQDWYERHCRERAEALGIAGRVAWLGAVPRERLVAEYGAADLYCMPSLWEPYGLTYVEALACGTPVLGLAAGGVPSIVRDGVGWLVEPTTQEEVVAGIGGIVADLAADRARAREAGRLGRARAERTWSWDALGTRLMEIYDEVAR